MCFSRQGDGHYFNMYNEITDKTCYEPKNQNQIFALTGWTEILARYRRSSLLLNATVDPSLFISLHLVTTTKTFIVFDRKICSDYLIFLII